MYIYSMTTVIFRSFMNKYCFRLAYIISGALCAASCSSIKNLSQPAADISSLKLISVYNIPFNFQFKNTTVGGLSGIDYNAEKKIFYLISDDRSERNPARFYTARMVINQTGIDSLEFTDVKYLKQANGDLYPGFIHNKYLTPDPEAIRYNPKSKLLAWTSEGERIVKPGDTVLNNPSVIFIKRSGIYKDSLELSKNMQMSFRNKGPRKNGVFEGMTFAENFKTLFVSVEEPLYEDGPRADITDNNAFIRILKYDLPSKKCTSQFAYKLEPVAYPAEPKDEFKVNGVPDILCIGNNKLLVIERSFSTGRTPCTIKLFVADLNSATDISNMALEGNKDFEPAKKSLVLNMDDLGIYTDNIEGVTFGPVLPNGKQSLIFIADNNFNAFEQAQVLLFEIDK